MPEADGMKKKIIAGAVLVLLMVLMPLAALGGAPARSEEHTSELQSQ